MCERPLPPEDAADERQLLARARSLLARQGPRLLSADELAELTRRHGIDLATALLYEQLRASAEHGRLIQALDPRMRPPQVEPSGERSSGPPRGGTALPELLLVPGGCHGESSDSRHCLERVRGQVERLGYRVRVVPTSSFGRLEDNAERVREALRESGGRPIRLVSLSKGSAEVKLALRDGPEDFATALAWINVSGLLDGSQWVSWLLDRKVSRAGARLWCWYYGYPFEALEQLRRGPGSLLDFPLPTLALPTLAHMRVIHVVGFPLQSDLTHRYTVRSHRRLAELGPNDGMGIMLGDLTRAGGEVYPVWRADHFLRPGDAEMSRFVAAVLRFLDAEQKTCRREVNR